jgi:hypothetical protein
MYSYYTEGVTQEGDDVTNDAVGIEQEMGGNTRWNVPLNISGCHDDRSQCIKIKSVFPIQKSQIFVSRHGFYRSYSLCQ